MPGSHPARLNRRVGCLTKTARGRKPAGKSMAAEIRAKLIVWHQTPEPRRPSLRALAAEMRTSHQLLSYHLARYDEWRPRDGEDPLTAALGTTLAKMRRKAKAGAKRGELSKLQLRLFRMLAKRGFPEAQELLAMNSK